MSFCSEPTPSEKCIRNSFRRNFNILRNGVKNKPISLLHNLPYLQKTLRRIMGSKSIPSLSELNLNSVENRDRNIDWQKGWYTITSPFRWMPGFEQPDLIQSPLSDKYFCYYEYKGGKYQWNIGLAVSDNVLGEYDRHIFPLLSPTNQKNCPAETGIADPTVLYIEKSEPPWHMWFDMQDGSEIWRIGHATSKDGYHWKIQRSNDGTPSVLIDVGKPGTWDDKWVHAPEAFLLNGKVRLIYNAIGTGHIDYDGGLAIASDKDGFGYAFNKFGQTTHDDTALGGKNIRVKKPIEINNFFYALHGRDTRGEEHHTICRSRDGCKSWEIVDKFPFPLANNLFLKDDYVVCIGVNNKIHVKRLPSELLDKKINYL